MRLDLCTAFARCALARLGDIEFLDRYLAQQTTNFLGGTSMSGHSKWNNIKRKKEKTDGARAKIFTKIGREISVAVREGGSDPASNSKLAALISKAKANNVPNDNIQRTIKRAEGGEKEKLAKIEENAKRELGMIPPKPFSPEDIRGKFVGATKHLKRRKESGRKRLSNGMLLMIIVILILIAKFLYSSNFTFNFGL